MADFKIALEKTLNFEGGYSNVEGDSGGETYRGISRKNFPNWTGWSVIDSNKPLQNGQIIQDQMLNQYVKYFYQSNFWLEDAINDQDVANKIFDISVNMGIYRTSLIVQQALVNDERLAINIDGKLGKETITAINRVGKKLLQDIIKRGIIFYKALVIANPSSNKFLDGWIKRIQS